jgi:hypothetical protein
MRVLSSTPSVYWKIVVSRVTRPSSASLLAFVPSFQ